MLADLQLGGPILKQNLAHGCISLLWPCASTPRVPVAQLPAGASVAHFVAVDRPNQSGRKRGVAGDTAIFQHPIRLCEQERLGRRSINGPD